MSPFGRTRTLRPIVLLTDFGFRDSYVGVMKGVISGITHGAEVIDLSHNIMPHDVAEAAFVLSASYRYFPEDSIFVCVVDPGVGTDRAVLCARVGEMYVLAPDNGLLSVLSEEREPDEIRRVTAEEYFLTDTGATFHGRDVFAPVAAHLACGLEMQKLGPKMARARKLRLPKPLMAADGSMRGEIIYIDQFGNLITNVRQATLRRSFSGSIGELEVTVKRRKVSGVCNAYGDKPEGELVALVGSSGYLEVAINQGSAARALGCEKGDTVTITPAS
jgi:S-adenosylmethionine hydrolase